MPTSRASALRLGRPLRLCRRRGVIVSTTRTSLKRLCIPQAGLAAEVQKFTRELPQGMERQTLELDKLEETPLPQKTEGSDAPIMSSDVSRLPLVIPTALVVASLAHLQ